MAAIRAALIRVETGYVILPICPVRRFPQWLPYSDRPTTRRADNLREATHRNSLVAGRHLPREDADETGICVLGEPDPSWLRLHVFRHCSADRWQFDSRYSCCGRRTTAAGSCTPIPSSASCVPPLSGLSIRVLPLRLFIRAIHLRAIRLRRSSRPPFRRPSGGPPRQSPLVNRRGPAASSVLSDLSNARSSP